MTGAGPARLYLGKYRGQVLDNRDPLGLARVLVEVPAVPGVLLDWALPCLPPFAPALRVAMVPELGAHVWVEFEGGDPNFPVWTGCFWQEGELAQAPAGALEAGDH